MNPQQYVEKWSSAFEYKFYIQGKILFSRQGIVFQIPISIKVVIIKISLRVKTMQSI